MHFSYKLLAKEKMNNRAWMQNSMAIFIEKIFVKSMDSIADGLLEGLCTKWIMG